MFVNGFLTTAFKRSFRNMTGRSIWTRPNIAATFRTRPTYLKMFKEVWLDFMWGNPQRRRLREAVAVAVSAANQCRY